MSSSSFRWRAHRTERRNTSKKAHIMNFFRSAAGIDRTNCNFHCTHTHTLETKCGAVFRAREYYTLKWQTGVNEIVEREKKVRVITVEVMGFWLDPIANDLFHQSLILLCRPEPFFRLWSSTSAAQLLRNAVFTLYCAPWMTSCCVWCRQQISTVAQRSSFYY